LDAVGGFGVRGGGLPHRTGGGARRGCRPGRSGSGRGQPDAEGPSLLARNGDGAGRPIRIELANQDGALEEFDSDDLRVERDVTPHGRVSFTVGPLKPGSYSFMGELHADTASGVVQAVETP
jgi:hypothetical protein